MSPRTRRRREMMRLLDLGAGVRVDLEPYGNLDDDWGLPLHSCFPQVRAGAPEIKVGMRRCQPPGRRVNSDGDTRAMDA